MVVFLLAWVGSLAPLNKESFREVVLRCDACDFIKAGIVGEIEDERAILALDPILVKLAFKAAIGVVFRAEPRDPTVCRETPNDHISATNFDLEQDEVGHIFSLEDPCIVAFIISFTIVVRLLFNHEVVDHVFDRRECLRTAVITGYILRLLDCQAFWLRQMIDNPLWEIEVDQVRLDTCQDSTTGKNVAQLALLDLEVSYIEALMKDTQDRLVDDLLVSIGHQEAALFGVGLQQSFFVL